MELCTYPAHDQMDDANKVPHLKDDSNAQVNANNVIVFSTNYYVMYAIQHASSRRKFLKMPNQC